MDLQQVNAIVTGGASGLGLATVRYLLEHGARVSVWDISEERGKEAVRQLGASAAFVRTDVTSESSVQQAAEQAVRHMGGVNALVHCAGVLGAGRVLGKDGPMPAAAFEQTIKVNLLGCFNVVSAAVQHMQRNEPGADGERGVIINTASIAAFEGQVGQVAYAASKGGIVSMTLPLAREFARIGVRVVAIAPGVFHTPMVEGMPPAVHESLCAQVPYPSRLGNPDEFASTVGYILANRYVNGTTLRVDGAIRLQPK